LQESSDPTTGAAKAVAGFHVSQMQMQQTQYIKSVIQKMCTAWEGPEEGPLFSILYDKVCP